MNKKKILMILIGVVLVVGAVVCAFLLTIGKPLSQKITAKGYEISVPKNWSAEKDGTLKDKKGNEVGKLILINEEPDLENMVSYAGFSVKGDVSKKALTAVITKNTFGTDKGTAVQYFIQNIPNPEPYAISLTFLQPAVDTMLGNRIAASLKIPEIGARPPKKNITPPIYDDIGEDKTAVLSLMDGYIEVKNTSLIDVFMSHQKKAESTGLDIISYQETEEGVSVAKWSHIESDGGHGYLYTYYDSGDGTYTYDNNPLLFDSITKDINREKGITAYCLKIGDTQTTQFLEIPSNLYRDYAETLATMQTNADNDKAIMEILAKLFTEEEIKSISASKTDEGLKIVVGEDVHINKAKLSKDVTVLFALVKDVNTVIVEKGSDKYRFERKKVLAGIEQKAEEATKAPEKFAQFAEEIENVPPAKAEGEEEQPVVQNGTVVYSTTVYVSASTKVKHPRTGKMVAIGPYAERVGVSQYLNKPIYCVIKRSGTGYLATATCGGSVIYSQKLKTEAELQNAIRQIQAYA